MLKTLHKKKTTRPGSWLHPGPNQRHLQPHRWHGGFASQRRCGTSARAKAKHLQPRWAQPVGDGGWSHWLDEFLDIYGTTDLVRVFCVKNKENIPGFQGNKYGNQHLGWSKHQKKGSSALPETTTSTHTPGTHTSSKKQKKHLLVSLIFLYTKIHSTQRSNSNHPGLSCTDPQKCKNWPTENSTGAKRNIERYLSRRNCMEFRGQNIREQNW